MTHERLTKIPPGIARLTELKAVVLRQNRIAAIDGLDALEELEELDLYDNLIGKIENLDKLTTLT